MKKARTFLVLFLLLPLLVLPGAGRAGEAAEEKPAAYSRAADSSLWGWLYVPSSLPEGIVPAEWSESALLVPAEGAAENPVSCTAEFVAGDPALKDAVCFRERDITGPETILCVDNEKLTAPCSAVFRIRLESAHYTAEGDCTLRVLSWEEYPLATRFNGDPAVSLTVGSVFSADDLLAVAFRDHREEIVRSLAAADETIPWEIPGVESSLQVMGSMNLIGGGLCEAAGLGAYSASASARFGNVRYSARVAVNVSDHLIEGPAAVLSGSTAAYTARAAEGAPERTFTWSVEGDGFSVDPQSGVLTVADGIPAGTVFVLRASPADGSAPLVLNGRTILGVLPDTGFSLLPYAEGFSVPLITGSPDFLTEEFTSESAADESSAYAIRVGYGLVPQKELVEQEEYALACYEAFLASGVAPEALSPGQDETVRIGGHPVRLITSAVTDPVSGETVSSGLVLYARNSALLYARVTSRPLNGTAWEGLPKVITADLRKLAEMIIYDPSGASFTLADGSLTVSAKDGADSVSGGKTLSFSAAFADPEKVNPGKGNAAVVWSVADPETGKTPEGVSIDARGVLSAGREVSELLRLEVKAESPVFHTSASCPVTVVPLVAKLTAEPESLLFYTGTDASAVVRILSEPADAPAPELTWTAGKKGLLEITDLGNGTAEIRPLKPGKLTVTVKEPGGRSVKISVSVLRPVENVTLTAKGRAVPGGTVTVKAAITPKKAGNRHLDWALDVEESVATISKKGKVTISKDTPVGTKITVTCTAPGAPEPVVRTIVLEVAEKQPR